MFDCVGLQIRQTPKAGHAGTLLLAVALFEKEVFENAGGYGAETARSFGAIQEGDIAIEFNEGTTAASPVNRGINVDISKIGGKDWASRR